MGVVFRRDSYCPSCPPVAIGFPQDVSRNCCLRRYRLRLAKGVQGRPQILVSRARISSEYEAVLATLDRILR